MSLKSKYLIAKLEENLLNKNTILCEALNSELLNKFKLVIQQGEELDDLLNSTGFSEFGTIVKELNTLLRHEFKKSTDFFGNDKSIRAKIKSWLQQHWKNGAVERFERFIEQLDDSLKQVINNLDALIPVNRRTSETIINFPDSRQNYQQIYDVVKNSFNISDPNKRTQGAIKSTSEKIIHNLGFEQLQVLSDSVSRVRTSVVNSAQNIENSLKNITNISQKQTQVSKDSEVNDVKQVSQAQEQPLNVNSIIGALTSLSPEDYRKLIRYINAKRGVEQIKL